jgi:hypothetical protein
MAQARELMGALVGFGGRGSKAAKGKGKSKKTSKATTTKGKGKKAVAKKAPAKKAAAKRTTPAGNKRRPSAGRTKKATKR